MLYKIAIYKVFDKRFKLFVKMCKQQRKSKYLKYNALVGD